MQKESLQQLDRRNLEQARIDIYEGEGHMQQCPEEGDCTCLPPPHYVHQKSWCQPARMQYYACYPCDKCYCCTCMQ